MALFSLIAVLLLEQIRPLPYRAIVHAPLVRISAVLEERFNAGEHRHGVVAWMAGTGGLVLFSGAVYALAYSLNPLLAWIWNVVVLYMTLGFRQFSHFFTDIQLALRMEDLPHARGLLAEWRGIPADTLSPADVARISIQEALMASHLHVFGVLLCFVLLPGPCGAVLYRAAAFFASQWAREEVDGEGSFGRFARQAFAVIDWLPSRATAAGFAIVGNFESAMYRWRNSLSEQSPSPLGKGPRIVLAAGTGALGLGDAVDSSRGEAQADASDGVDLETMQSAVGLVWRALLLWLLLILLMTLARLTPV